VSFIYLFIYHVLSTMQQTVQHRDNTMSTLKDAKAYSTHRRRRLYVCLFNYSQIG